MNEHVKPTGNAVATVQPRRSVLVAMSERYGMEPAAFEATVRATCMRPDKNGRVPNREEFAAFLLVAKEYNLNPLTKEIYAYAAKGGGIVPIVSIDGWANLINSHKALDGIEFEERHDDKGELVSCTCRIYRKDRSRPIEVTEYLSECRRDTDPWKMRHRMLRHKSLIQCARYAFGFSGIYDEDEGERIARSPAGMPRLAAPPPDPDAPEHDPETGEIIDVEHEEITDETGAPDPDGEAADVVDQTDDGAPDPDAEEQTDDEPASPRQAILDKIADEMADAETPDAVQKVWRAYDLDAKWGDGDADHKADLRIARGLMNQRDRELQKQAKK